MVLHCTGTDFHTGLTRSMHVIAIFRTVINQPTLKAMEHNYSVPDHDQPVHVNNNAATAFLGILLGLLLCIAFVSIAKGMGWHPVVGGILTGASGTVMGAMGTSTVDGNRAAIFGWAGATNFILGLLMFTGLTKGLVG